MNEYHVKQLDGSACQGKNCAAASGAMLVAFATAGDTQLTAAEFRHEANVSCVPGQHSDSGGLFVSDVKRVALKHGVRIDYGSPAPSRWSVAEAQDHLRSLDVMIAQGMYGALHAWAASSFKGTHSAVVHYRAEQPKGTVHFHDPLRHKAIDLPWSVFLDYWQTPGSSIRGYAGFAPIKFDLTLRHGGKKASPFPDRTIVDAGGRARIHSEPSKSDATVIDTIPDGDVFTVFQWATGDSYKGSRKWGANADGTRWVHKARLSHIGGAT